MRPLQLWGGVECTVNRVGDKFLDQSRLSGHHDRLDDLDRFVELGLKAIRYPLLWERLAPDRADAIDWSWSDERLARLQTLNVDVIAGLVHHGSGPRRTNLLDDHGFAAGLGEFAGRVAERYPWITDWTPVNEPLTTARFSALYGHWYPHHRDEGSMWRALLNQVDGTRLAMRAVRRINPAARLIQTDDLGRTYATIQLAEQAAFDNLRRWSGWDLLFGRVTTHHPLFDRMARFGLGDRLRAIADDPCPPDVIGVNHYLTSDRFLDHRVRSYPAHVRGGNDRVPYADTEAVRVLEPSPAGLAGALREAWQRYHTPLAVTEVHNGCTREEQLRWAAEAWDAAAALREQGVTIEAVTAWSLLGSHGWNTLLTGAGSYETGVFDVGGAEPRPTALARLWRGLPEGAARHPVVADAGWWRRPERLLHPSLARPALAPQRLASDAAVPILICGDGPMVEAFAQACEARGLSHVLDSAASIEVLHPWTVIDAREAAENAIGLAQFCAARGIGYLDASVRAHDEITTGWIQTALDRLIDDELLDYNQFEHRRSSEPVEGQLAPLLCADAA